MILLRSSLTWIANEREIWLREEPRWRYMGNRSLLILSTKFDENIRPSGGSCAKTIVGTVRKSLQKA